MLTALDQSGGHPPARHWRNVGPTLQRRHEASRPDMNSSRISKIDGFFRSPLNGLSLTTQASCVQIVEAGPAMSFQ
jgi:hypothetical protein